MYLVWVYGLLRIMFTELVEAMTIFERVFGLALLLTHVHAFTYEHLAIKTALTE